MATEINTLMVEGSFEDQILEMAQFIDIRKNQDPAKGLSATISELAEKEEREEALRRIIDESSALSDSPEKEFIPAYNLLIHLVRSSAEFFNYLPVLLENLSKPPPTSPHNGPALNISVLSTIFNVLPADSAQRYLVYRTMLKVIAAYGLYDQFKPELKNVERWVKEWGSSVEEIRELYLEIVNIAEEATDEEQFYSFLVKALRTFSDSDASSPQARQIASRLVKAAINLSSRLDLDELATFAAINALQDSDPELFQLYEVFAGGQLEDYIEFNDEHEGWIEDNGINHETAYRKIRLLTLTSLAAGYLDRSLPYNVISRRLHVPSEEVEHWVIDVIRAGLVEGKLSQLKQTFLIHRASPRTFGRAEWEEVENRLATWKHSLQGILEVIKVAKEQAKTHEGKEQQKVEGVLDNVGGGGGERRRGGKNPKQAADGKA